MLYREVRPETAWRPPMTALNTDWLVSVDDHAIEPPNVWLDRLPAKYHDVAPRMVDDRERRGLALRGQAGADVWALGGSGQASRGVLARSGALQRDAPRGVRLGRPPRRHGPGGNPRLAVFPVVPALLRPDLLGSQGQGSRRPVRAGLQRLDDRRVVRPRARPLHPARHHPAVGPAGRRPGARAMRRERALRRSRSRRTPNRSACRRFTTRAATGIP